MLPRAPGRRDCWETSRSQDYRNRRENIVSKPGGEGAKDDIRGTIDQRIACGSLQLYTVERVV
jgi:hypothetical protein